MSELELTTLWFRAFAETLVGRIREDERGISAEYIVITGFALLGAAAIAVVLWGKLKGGASNTNVPAPQAP